MAMRQRPFLTSRAHKVFALAHALADSRGDANLTPAHIALGLLLEGRSIAVQVLLERGMPLEAVADELEAELPARGAPRAQPEVREWTPDDERLVEHAVREARDLGTEFYGCEHLLLAFLRDPAGVPARILARHGVGFTDVHTEIRRILRPEPEPPPAQLSNRDDG